MNELAYVCDLPGLLVSVRSAGEARIALDGGADVIDVKEPARGSLGAADADVVAGVVAAVAQRVPISVAAGELVEFDQSRATGCANAGVSFIKFGLAGCGSVADWRTRWRAAISRLPAHSRPVAVAYADWQFADAPPPDDVLAEAVAVGCPALLVDTWDKSAGALFDLWPAQDVALFCQRVSKAGTAAVLAGSLDGPSLATAVGCGAKLVAIRGAVCEGGRTGAMSAARVRAVRAALGRAVGDLGVNSLTPRRRGEVTSLPR
jgi:uncharacterized protein (UPF0264 family)